MSESKYLFKRVKKTASNAIEAERNGDLKSAFDFFLKAAELLNEMIAIEKTKKIRDTYYIKAKEYITRAKELKALIDGPPSVSASSRLPDVPKKDLPKPPPAEKKPSPPLPPPPKDEKLPPPSPPPKEKSIPPPPPEDMTSKLMRGEDDEINTDPPLPPKTDPKTPPKKEIEIPAKTTFELLLDEGKYKDCVIECAKSVEAELRVRMGQFDEQQTLGMLINHGMKKGMEVLNDFKFVNILLNRIEHENYRPTRIDAQRAVEITTKILMS